MASRTFRLQLQEPLIELYFRLSFFFEINRICKFFVYR